jgi:SAM-dependent methyltransferase
MDDETIDAYDRDAVNYADDWETQPAPTDLHDVVRHFFTPGLTADIGCGSGRDAAWLSMNGYPAIGFDASKELLREARARHLGIAFEPATLPDLAGVDDARFANVLCETVIMHLPTGEISPAVGRLLAILAPGGTLYLSWRVTQQAQMRDRAGRRYTAVDADLVLGKLAMCEILYDRKIESLSSGQLIRRLVARKPQRPARQHGAVGTMCR